VTTKKGCEQAKILLYDIETSPNIAYIWGKYEQNALGDFIQERKMISVAWKWLGEKKVHVIALPDFPGYKKDMDDNSKLVKKFYDVFCQADIVIGHNVRSFDNKMINADFIRCGLNPPAPYKSIDTMKVARRHFRFNSNKLDDLGKMLCGDSKVQHTGFKLWRDCLAGKPDAWAMMKRYNKQDVALLEKVYLKLRPWMTQHPNLNEYTRQANCPGCGSPDLTEQGHRYTLAGKKKRYKCNGCGKWSVDASTFKESRIR